MVCRFIIHKKQPKRAFSQLSKAIVTVLENHRLNDLARNLESEAAVFDKLHCAMRIALPSGKNGINDNGDSTDMKRIFTFHFCLAWVW
jgi:hypothetical protein